MSEAPPEVTPDETPTPTPEAPPKPSETVDFWKQKAREQENRAKSNATAAQRLQELEESQKTEQQKIADRATAAEQARDAAVAESLRYKAAATHKVDSEHFDLLGSGTEEEITERAKRVGSLLQAVAERDQLKAELDAIRGVQSTPRPVDQLKPGAIATGVDDSYPADWFPQSRART